MFQKAHSMRQDMLSEWKTTTNHGGWWRVCPCLAIKTRASHTSDARKILRTPSYSAPPTKLSLIWFSQAQSKWFTSIHGASKLFEEYRHHYLTVPDEQCNQAASALIIMTEVWCLNCAWLCTCRFRLQSHLWTHRWLHNGPIILETKGLPKPVYNTKHVSHLTISVLDP